jgi:hypothetical protein
MYHPYAYIYSTTQDVCASFMVAQTAVIASCALYQHACRLRMAVFSSTVAPECLRSRHPASSPCWQRVVVTFQTSQGASVSTLPRPCMLEIGETHLN